MSVRVTHAGKVVDLPAQDVTFIIATRFHGGDINVKLKLDGSQEHTFLATEENPTILFELIGLDKVGRVSGPMTANYTSQPVSYSVKRGDVGGVFRF